MQSKPPEGSPRGSAASVGTPSVGDPAFESHASLVARARNLALTHSDTRSDSGAVSVLEHGAGVADILASLGADETVQAAAYLVEPAERLPVAQIARDIDPVLAHIVERMRQLRRLGAAGGIRASADIQDEMLRRMLLAMADDIRVVLLCLADRLQRLRAAARSKLPPELALSRETLDVLAPLANRLGLWQIKWELEDLAFRFLEPETYRALASQLEEKRAERESFVRNAETRLTEALHQAGVRAGVSGRPKHLYSIHVKMKAKQRSLDGIQDLRGLRVIVDEVEQCYAALDIAHSLWRALPSEYDDYIARPKPNGYRSLHTVVIADDGSPLEIQIRTEDMHRFAEYGVASHWRYKEGRGGAVGAAAQAEQNVTWVRQLLAWQREVGQSLGGEAAASAQGRSSYVYALTPQARVIELPAGATAVDFAYHVHSGLGHRCRGARVDGQLIPLNRPLQTGQTVEIIAARESAAEGPSRDWLNPALGYVASPRARNKVRQWFNALELERDTATGRERVEKVLQREGRTALSFEELARRLGQPDVSSLFLAVAKEEIGPRQLEDAVRIDAQAQAAKTEDSESFQKLLRPGQSARSPDTGSVLIVGMDSLMNQLARCCRPLPPDPVVGFVTRGRGVSVHRRDCNTFKRLVAQSPERVIETSWDPAVVSNMSDGGLRRFAVEVEVRAHDRQGLLRDVSEVFARDRMNVTAVNTLSRNQEALMRFTVEAGDAAQLERTLAALRKIGGVTEALRKGR